MKSFSFLCASSVDDAISSVISTGGKYLSGGTNLVDLMKYDIEKPPALVDLRKLDLKQIYMAIPLAILDAVVHVQGPNGKRSIRFDEFFTLPGDAPHIDNTLQPAELILGIELPPSPFGAHSWYLKVRDRHSYAFALVSVAAGLEIRDGIIVSAAIAFGGVASKPWRVRAAEQSLVGKEPTPHAFGVAAELALEGAQPLSQNGFKVDLCKHSVVRTLRLASSGPQTREG
jgi:xanthine dehydrogenase YagS FAD-binding subunit